MKLVEFLTEVRETTNQLGKLVDGVMQDLECNSKQEVVVKKLWNDFIHTVNKRLFESHNILFYYDSYKILLNENKIQSEPKFFDPPRKPNIEYRLALFNLTQHVQDQLLTHWNKRHTKAITSFRLLVSKFT